MALTNKLISYWNLQEASGSRADAYDSNTLTDNATVTQGAGPSILVPQGALFTASNLEYLSHTSNPDLTMGDIDFTVVTWAYLTTKPASDMTIASQFKFTGSNDRSWALIYRGTTDRFRFSVDPLGTGVGGVGQSADNFGIPTVATWYFIVAWHDSVGNTINIQVNDGTANSLSHSAGVYASVGDFDVGALDNGASNFFDGRVAALGIWKRVLTSAEKTYLYNAGRGLLYQFPTGDSTNAYIGGV